MSAAVEKANRAFRDGEPGFYIVNPKTNLAVARYRTDEQAQADLYHRELPHYGPPAGLVVIEIPVRAA